ncbi:fatty acyl-AMP ligase [Agromyces protaetiae]|uniref:Fatty acyl-AMP ligase n=1 Tax=Agromyces protaetiae TaxID=2509455 RepID=A0A4V0YHH1_9MICO|nr:AMP-binding protein [Agromyces protaetiae]QAY74691.1 fatty acyl-AMP ligase [Agromyces protaetiae]
MSEAPTTLFEALRNTAAEHGDTRGIKYFESLDDSISITYADLEREAKAVAASLADAGYGIGTNAVIALKAGLDWPGAVWGAIAAGVTFLPAPVAGYGSPANLIDGVAAVARSGEANLLIVDRETVQRLEGLADLGLPVLFIEDLREGDPDAWVDPGLTPDTIAYLLFTSGSTGDPKGVIATHRTVLTGALTNTDLFQVDDGALTVGWAPMHHIMGLATYVLLPAISGIDSIIMPTAVFQKRPLMWLQLMSKYKATQSAAGNFAFDLVTRLVTDEQLAELDLSSIRTLFSGSEPVRPETVRAFLAKFAPTGVTAKMIAPAMGMTEAGLITAKYPDDELVIRRFDPVSLEAGRLVPDDGPDSIEWVSCGRPNPHTTVKIVDPDTLTEVSDGVVGEIWVSSNMVSPGYFRRPDATAEAFDVKLPGDDKGYLRTGDLAAVLDGQLYVTGRLKEMLIIRGRNLYPMDIEAAARTVSPAVGIGAAFELTDRDAAVGIVTEIDREALDASGETLDGIADQVRRHLMDKFSLPYLAVALVEAGGLPRTPTGKVKRTPTRRQLEAGELPTAHTLGLARV